MAFLKKGALIFFILVSTLFSLAFLSPSAFAAHTSTNEHYSLFLQHKTAYATDCTSNATTLQSALIYGAHGPIGLLEARYSPACNTAWARVTSYISSDTLWAQVNNNTPAQGELGICYCTQVHSPTVSYTRGQMNVYGYVDADYHSASFSF